MRVFLVCLLAVAAVTSATKQDTKTITRRGIWAQEQIPSGNLYNQYSSGSNQYSSGLYDTNNYANSYASNYANNLANNYASNYASNLGNSYASNLGNNYATNLGGSGLNILSNGVQETVVNRVVQVPVPVPQPVEVVRAVPVRVPQPYPVEVRRPVEVRVPQPYPVHVNKPYPVHVDRPVPVLVPHVARVTYPRVPVPVQVPQPYAVALQASAINYAGQGQNLGAYAVPSSSYSTIQSGPSSYISQSNGLGAYAAQSGYSGDSYISSNNYQRYNHAGSESVGSSHGSWGGASYPGLESSSNDQGYSYEPPAKRW